MTTDSNRGTMSTESRTNPRLPGAELVIVEDDEDIQFYDPQNPDASIRAAIDTAIEVGELRE